MAKGSIDILPEKLAEVVALLPLTVIVVGTEQSNSVLRVAIQGDGVSNGVLYQMVITDGPLNREVQLVPADPQP